MSLCFHSIFYLILPAPLLTSYSYLAVSMLYIFLRSSLLLTMSMTNMMIFSRMFLPYRPSSILMSSNSSFPWSIFSSLISISRVSCPARIISKLPLSSASLESIMVLEGNISVSISQGCEWYLSSSPYYIRWKKSPLSLPSSVIIFSSDLRSSL